MSQRAIRRAQTRRQEAERRRELLRRRRTALATGAAIGATALFAPSAMAADFVVDNTNDAPAAGACDPTIDDDCTLRDAVALANANTEGDQVLFDSSVTGSIRLTQGELVVNNPNGVAFLGPGADVLSISGDANDDEVANSGDSRIFNASSGGIQIFGLTLTNGYASGSGGAIVTTAGMSIAESAITNSRASASGGAISTNFGLLVQDTEIRDNTAAGGTGGGIESTSTTGPPALTIIGSTLDGNSAQTGGGGVFAVGVAEVEDSVISDNTSTTGGGGGIATSQPLDVAGTTISGNKALGGNGGGISTPRRLVVSDSTISGNEAPAGQGGGISSSGKYAFMQVADSTISGNSAIGGGGIDLNNSFDEKYTTPHNSDITRTSISGNDTTGDGAGLRVRYLRPGDHLTVERSTFEGNEAGGSAAGGAIAIPGSGSGTVKGEIRVVHSTLSGNTAGTGAAVALGSETGSRVFGEDGSMEFENSTVAANAAGSRGGGFFLGDYVLTGPQVSPTVELTSTIVGDNTASGSPQDLDRVDASTAGGFDLAFSLVEAPGDASITQTPAGSNILGADPQLGAIADNGGPTRTHLPAVASPVVDQGKAPARVTTDQRELERVVDGEGVLNARRGDATDIGSVEVQNPPPKQPDPPITPPPDNGGGDPDPPVVPRDRRPRATIEFNFLGDFRASRRELLGSAIDDNAVAAVQVAIVRKRRGRCSSMRLSGRFTQAGSCGKAPLFLDAEGTETWSFQLKRKLAKGNYIAYARAIDDKGQRQTSFGPRSIDPFRIGR